MPTNSSDDALTSIKSTLEAAQHAGFIDERQNQYLVKLAEDCNEPIYKYCVAPFPAVHDAVHVACVLKNLHELVSHAVFSDPQAKGRLHVLYAAALVHDAGMKTAAHLTRDGWLETRARHARRSEIERQVKTFLPREDAGTILDLASAHAKDDLKTAEQKLDELSGYLAHFGLLLQAADSFDLGSGRLVDDSNAIDWDTTNDSKSPLSGPWFESKPAPSRLGTRKLRRSTRTS
jgi:hypothetical protein